MTGAPKNPGLIYERIAKIMADVPAIGKEGQNKAQGFKFRSIDQVYDALHGLLAKHKVFFTPHVESQDRQILDRINRDTGKVIGKTVLTCLSVRYELYCADDASSIIVGPIPGEAMDAGDKASAKAMSLALKYMLLQVFCIPIQAEVDFTNAVGAEPENGNSKAAEFLNKQKPAPSKNVFETALDELAVRDLKGWTLRPEDYQSIRDTVKQLSGAKTQKDAAAFVRESVVLKTIDGDGGEVLGVQAALKEAATSTV